MLVNIQSDFRALGVLTGDDVMGDIGLLLVNPSGVETISASRISLNCCWLSHLPFCLYKFLMFSMHLCSYIALLLKDGWMPMICTWYYLWLDRSEERQVTSKAYIRRVYHNGEVSSIVLNQYLLLWNIYWLPEGYLIGTVKVCPFFWGSSHIPKEVNYWLWYTWLELVRWVGHGKDKYRVNHQNFSLDIQTSIILGFYYFKVSVQIQPSHS